MRSAAKLSLTPLIDEIERLSSNLHNNSNLDDTPTGQEVAIFNEIIKHLDKCKTIPRKDEKGNDRSS